jgi:hypothetical protein
MRIAGSLKGAVSYIDASKDARFGYIQNLNPLFSRQQFTELDNPS